MPEWTGWTPTVGHLWRGARISGALLSLHYGLTRLRWPSPWGLTCITRIYISSQVYYPNFVFFFSFWLNILRSTIYMWRDPFELVPLHLIRTAVQQLCDTYRSMKTSLDWTKINVYRLISTVVANVRTLLCRKRLDTEGTAAGST